MTPANVSLITGALLGFIAAMLILGYSQRAPADRCSAVAQAYSESHRTLNRESLRGAQDENTGLSIPESTSITIAGIVSRTLGVSCFVVPV